MRKGILVGLFLLLGLLSFAKGEISLRVADYPPNYFKDANGNWTGIDVDLAVAVIKEAGYEPVFREVPWSRALAEMKTGKLDMMANLSMTDERAEYMMWVGPERLTEMALVVNKNNKKMKIENLDDLIRLSEKYKFKIGLQEDVFYSKEFNGKLDGDPIFKSHFEFVSDAILNARKTKFSRIFGFFEEKLTMVENIKKNEEYEGLVIHGLVLSEDSVYFGISKAANAKKDIFNSLSEAHNRLKEKGKLKEINDKYYR